MAISDAYACTRVQSTTGSGCIRGKLFRYENNCVQSTQTKRTLSKSAVVAHARVLYKLSKKWFLSKCLVKLQYNYTQVTIIQQ